MDQQQTRSRKHSPRLGVKQNSYLRETFGSLAFWMIIVCAIAGVIIRWSRTHSPTGAQVAPEPAPRRVSQVVNPAPARNADSVQRARPVEKAEATNRSRVAVSEPGAVGSLSNGTNANACAIEQSCAEMRAWAEKDPESAAEWAKNLAPGPVRREALGQLAIVWGNSDLSSAVKWFSELPEDNNGSKASSMLVLANEAARTEPATALEVAGALEPSPERDNALAHAISQWAGSDGSAAAAWALKVPDMELKQHLVGAVAVALAEKEPSLAATLASGSMNPGEEQDRAAVSVVQRWVQTAPEQAADWVAHYPESPARAAAAENLFAIWTAQDATAAAQYVAKLPEGWLRQAGTLASSQVSGAE